MQFTANNSLAHFQSLIGRSNSIFDLGIIGARLWSYFDWKNIFDIISKSIYWLSTEPNKICIDYITVPNQFIKNPAVENQKVEITSNAKRMLPASRAENGMFKSVSSPKSKREFCFINQKIEEVNLCDSSYGSSSADTGSSFEGQNSVHNKVRKHRKSNLRQQREVVKPENFEINGWQSLRKFLATYESYFYNKFDGDSRDCTQEIRSFLPTEMQKVFDALGGRRLKYLAMKEELLAWYKNQHRGGSKYWSGKLQETQ